MTGGGVYPALAVHQALESRTQATLWVGSEHGLEESLLAPFALEFTAISGGGIHGMGIAKLPRNALALMKGYRESLSIIREFNPDVIFFTGGYIGVPMAMAAGNIPSVVFIPDIEPGLALRLILRNANHTAIATKTSLKYLKSQQPFTITGYPIRNELKEWTRERSRAYFDIKPSENTLLVFGGSKGARSINNALFSHIDTLLKDFHIIHITGEANWDQCLRVINTMQLSGSKRYHPYPFLHKKMGAALSAADLVICRAGASTIGELPHFGLPAILVPYPHAWRYQHQNAEYLVSNGGAVLLKDEDLKENLYDQVQLLIQDEERIKKMQKNMHALAKEKAAEHIADIIYKIGTKQSGGMTK